MREKVDPDKTHTPEEAVVLIKELATSKFDETVELHLRTGADTRHADQFGEGCDHLALRSGQGDPGVGVSQRVKVRSWPGRPVPTTWERMT